MKKILNHLKTAAGVLLLSFSLLYAFSAPVSAAAKDDVCKGVNLGGGSCSNSGTEVSNVIAIVVNILSLVAGIAAVIMIIIGGLRYITSGGDSSKVASAKTTIIYSIVGLVIVAMAQFIVRYVLDAAK